MVDHSNSRDQFLTRAREARSRGDLAAAEQIYRQCVEQYPDDAEFKYFLGMTCWLTHHYDEAEILIERAIDEGHRSDSVYYNFALLLQEQGKAEAAISQYQNALVLNAELEDANNNQGFLYFTLGQFEEAAECFLKEIASQPANIAAHNNLGNVLKEQFKFDAARRCYLNAIKLDSTYVEALSNLANVLYKMGHYQEALAYADRSIELEPDNADAWNNRGMIMQGLGRYSEVVENFHKAIQLQPEFNEAHTNYATANLLLGNFKTGWHHYRYRLNKHADNYRFLQQPLARDLHGRKVILSQDQGIGDELFFLRYAAQLKQRGAWVGYHPGQKIRSLLQSCDAIDALLEESMLEDVRAEHIYMSVGDLAFALGVNDDDPLPPSMVLKPLPEQIDAMQQYLSSLGPPPYVGVTWRGGTIMRSRLYKEIPLAPLGQCLHGINATMVSLQRCPKDTETQQLAEILGQPVHDASALNDDLEAMLALLNLLHDYIGVSNTNMHMIATLGKTARVLVPAPAEWRWMLSGDESPWFPGFRLYRQTLDKHWGDALAMLRKDMGHYFEH